MVDAILGRGWTLSGGVFRSMNDNPVSFADLYVDTRRDGTAEHLLIGYPEQRADSTSGEIRLTGRFAGRVLRHQVIFALRGRDVVALYNGADVKDAGAADVRQANAVSPPAFTDSARTRDRNQLWGEGLAYRGSWVDHAELSIGTQHITYRRLISAPDGPLEQRADQSWRCYAIAAVT